MNQHRMLYPGSLGAHVLPSAPEGFAEIYTRPAPGLVLRHAFLPPKRSGLPTVLVFQGNAGDWSHRLQKVAFLSDAGYGLLMVGYRGYSGNPGEPSEKGLIADALSVYDWLMDSDQQQPPPIFYGESLGSGPAIALATRRLVSAVLLESPFDSVARIAKDRFPWIPVGYLLRDHWDSGKRIQALQAPLFVAHAQDDKIVPFVYGKSLFVTASVRKEAFFSETGGHIGLLDQPEVQASILRFLAGSL